MEEKELEDVYFYVKLENWHIVKLGSDNNNNNNNNNTTTLMKTRRMVLV